MSLLTLLALVGAVVVVGLLFFAKEGPGDAGSKFMDALARGDAATLSRLSYLAGREPDAIRKDWDFATSTSGKHYFFRWRMVNARSVDDESGSVTLMVERNLDSGAAYEEKFELPMVKQNGEWRVDVAGISRDLYPGLPRAGR